MPLLLGRSTACSFSTTFAPPLRLVIDRPSRLVRAIGRLAGLSIGGPTEGASKEQNADASFLELCWLLVKLEWHRQWVVLA